MYIQGGYFGTSLNNFVTVMECEIYLKIMVMSEYQLILFLFESDGSIVRKYLIVVTKHILFSVQEVVFFLSYFKFRLTYFFLCGFSPECFKNFFK